MKENDPLILVTLCIVIALFAAVTEVKVLREQVKRLEERYEALLDLLPQEEFSYAGTHPKWVADAVEENTLDKETTKDDVASLLEQCETLEDLKEGLVDYFELEDLE